MNKRPFRFNQPRVAYLHDVLMAGLSFVIALYLRLGDSIYLLPDWYVLKHTALFMALAAALFWPMGLYRGVWRYASVDDLMSITRAVTALVLVFLPAVFLMSRLEEFPRSVVIINWFVLLILLGGPRFLYRLFKDGRVDLALQRRGRNLVPVVLVGAGDEADLFIRAMARNPDASYHVVGVIDDKGGRIGRRIHRVPVLGGLGDVEQVVDDLALRGERPQRLILTRPQLSGDVVRQLLEDAEQMGMSLVRMPDPTDFRAGDRSPAETKPIDIEDLLGRPQAVLDRPAMKAMIAGRRVMVTGAGGTIGAELCRQIASFEPSHLSLVDFSEFNLYSIDMELGEHFPALARSCNLADVRDREKLARLMEREQPMLVFHAAALKHVPMVEANANEGVRTNVGGTRNVADACKAAGVEAMILISTDKAVNPTNIMGATKRLAESYCQSLDIAGRHQGSTTRFLTVRFGNVLGSTGSVVPLFERQLKNGGPLTVTDPNVERYFMTVREAVELVLQASTHGLSENGEHAGEIFVLDMGTPVRILDLAEQMIRLAGLRPGKDIEIRFTGLRPGEKMYEELFHGSEPTKDSGRDGILIATPRTADHAVLSRAVDELVQAAHDGRTDDTLRKIESLVPEYTRPATTRPDPGTRREA